MLAEFRLTWISIWMVAQKLMIKFHVDCIKMPINCKIWVCSVQCAKCIWYALCIMCTSDRQMLCNNVLKIMVNNGDRNNSSWFLTRTAMQLSNWMLLYQMPQFNCEMFSAHWTKGERKSERRERECKAKKKNMYNTYDVQQRTSRFR